MSILGRTRDVGLFLYELARNKSVIRFRTK